MEDKQFNVEIKDNKIILNKELNSLDTFVISFIKILDKLKINYVIISGYVSILFGRNRSSEDIDIIIEKIDFLRFKDLWAEVNKNFECLNTENPEEAYKEYLLNHTSIRFSEKKKYIPNIELKFPNEDSNPLDLVSLKEKKLVNLNKNPLFISPIEIQIAFKFFLGSEKDIEDALYLYEIFKNKLNISLIQQISKKLEVKDLFDKYIK